MLALGDLPGGIFSSEALGVSADGSIVIGWSSSGPEREGLIWDAQLGMRPVRDALVNEHGLDLQLQGWTSLYCSAITPDGRTLVGSATNPAGQSEAWLAYLGPCPGDFNRSSSINSQDFFDYLNAFFAGDAAADLNADGQVTSQDFFDFLTAFFAGCP